MEEEVAATRGKEKNWTPGTRASVLEVNSSGGERPEAAGGSKEEGREERRRRRGRSSTTDEALGTELHHVPELHDESRMRQSWRRCF